MVLNIDQSGRRWYVTSPDRPGLFVSESTMKGALSIVPDVLSLLDKAQRAVK